jgi:hypothetical protein
MEEEILIEGIQAFEDQNYIKAIKIFTSKLEKSN